MNADLICVHLRKSAASILLPREGRADIRQQLVRANRTVTMLLNQSIDNFINTPQLIRIGRYSRSSDLHHVLQVSEDLLLDRFFQALVRVVLERFALARV